MPSALPTGEPAPPRRPPAVRRVSDAARAPFGVYVHVPFCETRCGYCDFNTYTAAELGPASAAAPTPTPCCSSLRLAAGARRRRAVPTRGRDGLLRRRDADAAAGRASRPDHARDRANCSAWRPTSRSRPRPTPSRSRRRTSASCAQPASPGCRSACSRPSRTCSTCSIARTARAARRRRSPRPAPPGFEHVNLDLIYGTPYETRRRLAGLARRRVRAQARPHQRVRARRRGGHGAGPSGRARGRAGAGRRRARRPLRAWPTRPLRAAGFDWYEVSNWARRRPPAADTTSCTGATRTGGASARARTATSAACAGGTSSTRSATRTLLESGAQPGGRARDPRRRCPPDRAGHARHSAARRACRCDDVPRRARDAVPQLT